MKNKKIESDKTVVGFKIPINTKIKLDRILKKKGFTKSEYFTLCVEHLLKSEK